MDGSREKGKEGRTDGLTNSYINRQKEERREGRMDG